MVRTKDFDKRIVYDYVLMNALTYVFVLTLVLSLAARLWLTTRQRHSVIEQRQQVPSPFRDYISLEAHHKAADYTVAGLTQERLELLLGALLLLAWTLGGGLDWLDRYWAEKGLSPLNRGVCVILSLMFITHVVELPLTIWRTFVLEQRFDFNHTTVGLFISDQVREIFLTLLIATPLLFVILWMMLNQSNWWLTVWLVWSGFSLFMLWAYPTLIAPLFNRFTLLDDPILKQRIDQLLQRTNFTSNGIFVMDSSRRSGHGNAYFTGLGHNKRIVFYDTLLKSLNHDEIEAVLAHELGHFHHGHVRMRLLTMVTLSLTALILLAWLSKQTWFFHGLGVNSMEPHLALILLVLCAPVFGFFLRPIFTGFTRRHEYQADDFAANHADAGQLVNALLKLYDENATTLTPDPLYSAVHDSHPTALARINNLHKHMSSA